MSARTVLQPDPNEPIEMYKRAYRDLVEDFHLNQLKPVSDSDGETGSVRRSHSTNKHRSPDKNG